MKNKIEEKLCSHFYFYDLYVKFAFLLLLIYIIEQKEKRNSRLL